MAYVVTQSCCADASCVVACPVNCIHPAPGEPGFATAEMLYVDPTSCVGCGACATACPVGAVLPASVLTPAQQPFAELNAAYYDAFPHADRSPLALVPPQRRLRRPAPLRVAVVGAGPAGLYTADELLRHPEVRVDVLDRLPTPYGLLRAGVAPDHPHTREAARLFAAIEGQPGFSYLLGVEVGRDVTPEELAAHYDAVVYAVGAAEDRPLGIAGEHLPGSVAAADLVRWYNGHPDLADLAIDLDAPLTDSGRAVVVGHGNVALDIARILARDPDDLAGTDVSRLALATLLSSRVREVVVLGRRGPDQAAFTVPELIGLLGLAEQGAITVRVEGADACDAGGGTDLRTAGPWLARLAAVPPAPGARTVVLRFHSRPVRLVAGPEGRVAGIEIAQTRLEAGRGGAARAVDTGEREVLPAGLVVRAAGFRARPVPGLPWDAAAGAVPHRDGRVRPGTYVAGWVKRGPTGFIGSNKSCAEGTVTALLDDADAGLLDRGAPAPGVAGLLAHRGVPVVDLTGWRRIDAAERERGERLGRARATIVDLAELWRVAQPPAPDAGYPASRRGRGGRRTREQERS